MRVFVSDALRFCAFLDKIHSLNKVTAFTDLRKPEIARERKKGSVSAFIGLLSFSKNGRWVDGFLRSI